MAFCMFLSVILILLFFYYIPIFFYFHILCSIFHLEHVAFLLSERELIFYGFLFLLNSFYFYVLCFAFCFTLMLPVHFISTKKAKMTGTMLQNQSIILITNIFDHECSWSSELVF